MSFVSEISVGFSAWRSQGDRGALRAELERRLEPVSTVEPRILGALDGFIVERLEIRGLIAALDLGLRGDTWAVVVCARPVPVIRPVVDRAMVMAKRKPWGLVVRPDPLDPIVEPFGTALNLHASVLRARRPTAWRAIDALREHGTATRAAEALGISTQAVTRQIRQSNLRATVGTSVLVRSLFEAAAFRRDTIDASPFRASGMRAGG